MSAGFSREWVDSRKRTSEEITELARDVIIGRKYITNDARIVEGSFGMVITFMTGPTDKDALDDIAAMIGDMNNIVPGRYINGLPFFLSLDILHKDDREAYDAEVDRMAKALGIT